MPLGEEERVEPHGLSFPPGCLRTRASAEGFLQGATHSRVHRDGSRFDIDTWTWTATWSGHLADGWPDDGWVSLDATEDYEEDYLDGSWSQDHAFTWASPTCKWSLDFAQDYDGPLLTSWVFTQGSQRLSVTGNEADTCDSESVAVDLDGVSGTAASDGWTSLTDADGDGDCFEVDDCRDGTAAINPGAFDRPYDHIDQDCSGADVSDVDGDGWDSVRVGGADCNDASRRVNPARECAGG